MYSARIVFYNYIAIQMKIMKKNKEEEFWPRLLQDKNQEKTNVKIDWDRYVDEDEAEGKDFDTGRGYLDFFCSTVM